MTRKDYVAIAAAIRRIMDSNGRNDVEKGAVSDAAHYIADAMRDDNARFDRARFLEACGIH
jgi:hypothetical protein